MGQQSAKLKITEPAKDGDKDSGDIDNVVSNEEKRGENKVNEDAASGERRQEKRPAIVKTFLDEDPKEIGLDGAFSSMEQNALARHLKQQTLFLDDIAEEDITTTIPPPEEMKGGSSTKTQKKKTSTKKGPNGRKSKRKVAPFNDENEDDACTYLSSLSLKIVPTELFDIAVIPPPEEFSTPDFMPQDDYTIDENSNDIDEEVNSHVYRHLAQELLTPTPFEERDEPEENCITPKQLYNCMNDGQKSPYMYDPTFLLIIDARSRHLYDENHIATAHHLDYIQDNLDQFKPIDQYTMIVLYDHDGRQYSLKSSDISVAMDALLKEEADAFVLQGGFETFVEKFPYWCTSKVPSDLKKRAEVIINFPSIVLEDQLYIGNVDHANKEKTVRLLNISHILCISHEIHHRIENVTYHQIKLPDEATSPLYEYFGDAIDFIQSALDSRGRVLVHCNLGQSRSATIVAAYLMYSNKCTLADAYRYLRDCRPVVHPNEGFMNQLSHFENALFGERKTDIAKFGCKVQPITKRNSTSEIKKTEYNKDVKRKSLPDSKPGVKAASAKRKKTDTKDTLLESVKEAAASSNLVDGTGERETENKSSTHNGSILKYDSKDVNTVFPQKTANVSHNNNEIKITGIIHCKGKDTDEMNVEDFEEEIVLADTFVRGSQHNGSSCGAMVINEAVNLSASVETLENTIVAI